MQKPQSSYRIELTENDLNCIAYLAIRTKAVPDFTILEEANSMEVCFLEPTKRRARIILRFGAVCQKAHACERYVEFISDPTAGIDPMWNPTGVRLTETYAVFDSYDFKHHCEPETWREYVERTEIAPFIKRDAFFGDNRHEILCERLISKDKHLMQEIPPLPAGIAKF